ncbi:nodulin-related protein 1 [Lactuca sativa]|nr:nodulin-related protein 1 [Lactuca sativa]
MENETTADKDSGDHPSNSELMASAKVMSEAVTGQETDTGKIAGAAADILDAAATYGIVDEKQGLGKYMDQAEEYLHKYETTHTTTTKTDADGNTTTTETTTTKPADDDDKFNYSVLI